MATMRGAFLALTMVLMAAVSAFAADDDSLRAKALKLNSVTGNDPSSAKILELFKDPEGTKKLLAEATKMAKEKEQPFNVNATTILARAAHGLKQYDVSERFYRLNLNQALKLQSADRIGLAYNGLSQLLFDNKKYAESQKVCQEFMEMEVDPQLDKDLARFRFTMERRLIIALARQGETEKAKKLTDALIKGNPENWLLLKIKANVLLELDDSEGAVKAYETMINRIKKDDRLKQEEKDEIIADTKYSLSGVYIELNQVDKASEVLKALLEKDPDNPSYNNDLGYIWADHDQNLDEAEKLIRKAIEEDRKARKKENPKIKPEDDKDNASYLDSLGWVLFKKKKYKEAKEQLEQAVKEEDGKHLEIYDHLGDVLWALDEKKAAVDAWKAGVEIALDTKREKAKKAEMEKKISEKK